MTISEYIQHYLQTKETVIFGLLTLAVIVLTTLIFGAISCIGATGEKRTNRFENLSEEFYELIFSGGSILMFIAAYYLIDRFFMLEPYRRMWDKYKDYLLLLMIVLSIVISRIVDGALIRLRNVSKEDKAAIRLVAMAYMLLIFGYVKFIYENNNYDSFINYFLGLMIGRFVYFDVSLEDFGSAIKRAVTKLPIMLVALACTGLLSLYGFKSGYLIKHIGVITNVFFIHVYMTVAIFLVFYVYSIARAVNKHKQKKNALKIDEKNFDRKY